jgi:hypothetical protein
MINTITAAFKAIFLVIVLGVVMIVTFYLSYIILPIVILGFIGGGVFLYAKSKSSY